MPVAKRQELFEKYLKLQSDIKQGLAAVKKAHADSIPPEVILPMKTDVTKKIDLYKRLTLFFNQNKSPASTGTVPTPSSQPHPPGVTIPTSTTTPATDLNPSNPLPSGPELTQPHLPSTAMAQPQNLNVPNPTLPNQEQYPTEVVNQNHRLRQQQNQQSLPQQGIFSQNFSVFSPSPACRRHHTIARGKQPDHDSSAWLTTAMARHVFLGDREWCTRGYHLCIRRVSAKRRTVSGIVPLLTNLEMNVVRSHTATWPHKIQISAAPEKTVTPQEFHHWNHQNNGVLCRITAHRRPETSPNNEMLLSQLIGSLAEKSMVRLFLGPWLGCDAN